METSGDKLQATHNVAVQRRRAAVLSAAHVHNEMTHVRRAAIPFAPSAATACQAPSPVWCRNFARVEAALLREH